MTQAEQAKIVMRRRIDMRAEAPPGDWAPERIIQNTSWITSSITCATCCIHLHQLFTILRGIQAWEGSRMRGAGELQSQKPHITVWHHLKGAVTHSVPLLTPNWLAHYNAHYIIIICECEHVICVEDIQHKHNKHRKTDTKKRSDVGVILLVHK